MSLLLIAASVDAQDVKFDDSGDPNKATRILGLDVGGTTYDVEFLALRFAYEIYGDFDSFSSTFDTATEAEAAVDAVIAALNAGGATKVGETDNEGYPIFNIGFEKDLAGQTEVIRVWRAIREDGSDWIGFGQNPWSYNLDEKSWAVFHTPTPTRSSTWGRIKLLYP